MSDDEQNITDKSGHAIADHKTGRLSERLASVETISGELLEGYGGEINEDSEEVEPAANQDDHDWLFDRSGYGRPGSAGRMVIGSRAPTPGGSVTGEGDHLPAPMFSSAHGSSRRISSSAAVMLVCALAAGGTGSLAYLLGDQSFVSEAGSAEADVTAQPGDEQPAGATAKGAGSGETASSESASAAESSSLAADNRFEAVNSGLIQVAQARQAELKVEDVVAKAGTGPIPLTVSVSEDDSGEYAFLMFRGMDDGFTFSNGFRLKDAWAVSLRDVTDVRLIPPAGYEGQFKLEVLLVKGRNTQVISTSMSVRIEPAAIPAPVLEIAEASAPAAKATPVEAAPVPYVLTATPPIDDREIRSEQARQATAPAPAPVETVRIEPEVAVKPERGDIQAEPEPEVVEAKPVPTISPAQEEPLLKRALKLIDGSDIASARLLLEHLARRGSARGALALGQTYDPAFFRTVFTIGLKPDIEQARKWYKVAADLGQDLARQKLEQLASQ